MTARMPKIAVVGGGDNETNLALVSHWCASGLDAELVEGGRVRARVRPGDVAIGRIDVLPTLDGVEPGLLALLLLERAGVVVRNRAAALLAVHDKLRTARLLRGAAIPHPATALVRALGERIPIAPPLVVKPRFGSWGRDVLRCDRESDVERALDAVAARSWFRRHGALVQELVPPPCRDLRVLVAGGRVVGAVVREAAPGEWRTNVSLGGMKLHAEADAVATALSLAAVRATGCDLAAVDLLPVPGSGYVVIELNGAADFDDDYVPAGRSVYQEVASALGIARPADPALADPPHPTVAAVRR